MVFSVQAEGFDDIKDEWADALPSCSTNTIFLTPLWQSVWWRHFGKGLELSILSVREDGELVGIAPLALRDGVLSFLGDTDLFDYHDFVVRRGKEAVFYNALCEHLVKQPWHTFDLKSLPQDSPALIHIPPLAKGKGYPVEVAEEDKTPVAALSSTWDEYLAGLNKKDRHELRRKLRRLESTDHTIQYPVKGANEVAEGMKDFFRLLRASSSDKDTFMTPEREQFFLDAAQELARRGQVKLYFMEINGARVASCLCFDYADAYLLYNSGYDPAYSELSVGLLNKALCIKDAIEEGKRAFNFLRGVERYKYDLGGVDQSVYRLVVSRQGETAKS